MTLSTPCWAQEFDTVTFEGSRKAFTVLDQLEDPAERKAFKALLGEEDPEKKRRLAELFLAKYPTSWMLPEAYEIAAKAAIDTNDFAQVLLYGRESLRLMPENPPLLVPLANVQVHQGLLDEAAQSARDALAYLDHFRRPMKYSEKEWKQLESELRASSYYVLGRVALTRALAEKGPGRDELLVEAREMLSESRALYRDDPLAAYLLGVTELSLGAADAAAPHLAAAAQLEGPMKAKALEQLRRIHESSAEHSKQSFESYLRSVASQPPRLPKAQRRKEAPESGSEPARYAGSDTCRGCHLKEFAGWEKTGMARMFRSYQPENILGDFGSEKEFEGEDGSLVRMRTEGDRHYFEIRSALGRWERYRVDYTIGSKWQQAYATRRPNGQIHVIPIQYSKLHGKWVNFWKVIDPPGSPRAEIGRFHQLTTLTSYQLNCAACHTSQLQTETGKIQSEHLTFREAGINCEMCHGPSESHVAAMKRGEPYHKNSLAPPVDFQKIGHEDYVRICGQCHMQSGVLEPGAKGELNYSGRSPSFAKQYSSQPYNEFSRKAFYKDGRFRETTFIVEAFLRSACYKKGQAQCGHCHDPHPANAESNPKSLKFLDQPDQMCLQCHTEYAADPPAHTRHPASSQGSRCASCHMPPIMNSLLFQAGTHRIDDIPNAKMTLRFGQQESPNACLLCHTERDPAWVEERLKTW